MIILFFALEETGVEIQPNLIVKTDSQLQLPADIKQLANPIPVPTTLGLTGPAVLEISEALNLLIADAFALYIKTKNLHWHLAGSHFRDFHELFEEQADQVFIMTNMLLEQVRRIDGTTIRSLTHISRSQNIHDDNAVFVPAGQMLLRLLNDNKHLARLQARAHQLCVKHQDKASASALETMLIETECRIWFLFEVYQSFKAAE